MSDGAPRAALAILGVAALVAISAPARAAGKSPFVHEDPRWQISAIPSYAVVLAYDGRERRGGGLTASVLLQMTTAFSAVLEAGWSMLAPAGGPSGDAGPTHAIRVDGMIRYDLDVISLRPYFAVGGTIVIFPAGIMHDMEVERAGVAVACNWGPVIEAGLDWRPARWLALGLVLDMAWLLKYRPAPGKDWPSFRTIGIRAGVYF